MYKRQELDDEKKLVEYFEKEQEPVLDLIDTSGQGTIKLNVKLNAEEVLQVEVGAGSTVSDVKTLVEEQKGLQANEHVLDFGE